MGVGRLEHHKKNQSRLGKSGEMNRGTVAKCDGLGNKSAAKLYDGPENKNGARCGSESEIAGKCDAEGKQNVKKRAFGKIGGTRENVTETAFGKIGGTRENVTETATQTEKRQVAQMAQRRSVDTLGFFFGIKVGGTVHVLADRNTSIACFPFRSR